jgi:hypothetical protein
LADFGSLKATFLPRQFDDSRKGSNVSKDRILLTMAAVAVLAAAGGLASSAGAEDDLVRVSDAASPRVSYAVQKQGGTLVVLLAVETLSPEQENGGVNVRLGAAADKTVFLTGDTPERDAADGIVRFVFRIPAERPGDGDRGWAKLRLAFAVEWAGGPFGQPRQREAFLQSKTRATHAGLSSSPADWQSLNLSEFSRVADDRRLSIGFTFTQPCDGKATIVVEDVQGKRARNLVSGTDMDKGPQWIAWDGCDDQGVLLPPGEYR